MVDGNKVIIGLEISRWMMAVKGAYWNNLQISTANITMFLTSSEHFVYTEDPLEYVPAAQLEQLPVYDRL